MKLRRILIVIVLLLTLSACANSLSKTAQHKWSREETNASPLPSNTEDERDIGEVSCPDPDPHPIAEDIAEKFSTSYEKVIRWYCEGNLFEDIMLALLTSKLWGVEPDVVLKEILTKSWDEIWEGLENDTIN